MVNLHGDDKMSLIWCAQPFLKSGELWTLGVGRCRGIPSRLRPRAMWAQRPWGWGRGGRSWSRWPDTPTRIPAAPPRRIDESHHPRGSWPQGYGARWQPPASTAPDTPWDLHVQLRGSHSALGREKPKEEAGGRKPGMKIDWELID